MTTHENLERLATPLSEDAQDQLFRKARTPSFWLAMPVTDDTLRSLYELMKWGPTSANGCPARILFLRTPDAKQRLVPALAPANVEKVLSAPVTAIVGYDSRFYDQLPRLFPNASGMKALFEKSPELASFCRETSKLLLCQSLTISRTIRSQAGFAGAWESRSHKADCAVRCPGWFVIGSIYRPQLMQEQL
jgi:3-hydroxypropanoate dehydrogenase